MSMKSLAEKYDKKICTIRETMRGKGILRRHGRPQINPFYKPSSEKRAPNSIAHTSHPCKLQSHHQPMQVSSPSPVSVFAGIINMTNEILTEYDRDIE